MVAVRNAMPVSLQPQKRRFGLEESLKDVFKRLDMMKESQNVLGLVGMGGIGKTTLASEIYNHFVSHREFQYHCFLKDVRSSVPSELRRQLLRDLIQEDLNSPEEYQHKFEVCSRQRVLIIVDDIDNESQFTNLIPDIQLLGSGSRIIITSRHRDVLNITMRRAISKYIYEVKLLSRTDSQRLFNWNAFDSETPSTGFGDLAAKVAEACGGHPLALEVIGASLFDKREYPDDTEIWVDAVKTLNENEDILGKLRISYDCLPTEGDKAMFRDIACLLNGMPDEVAMMIWTSCNSCSQGFCVTSKTPHLVLRRLLDKSLVKLDSGRLSMHDVIRDMGRDVVIRASPKPEGRTHLWDTTTAAKVLRKNKVLARFTCFLTLTSTIIGGVHNFGFFWLICFSGTPSLLANFVAF